MPVKMRLQRGGKKARPFYQIVIADGRAPRDGKFIEKIGTYNPITNPAEIKIDFDRALYWLQTGAQPTDTVRSILSHKGIMYKNHLLNGIKKGAHTEEQAEAKFQTWLSEKESKVDKQVKSIEEGDRNALKKKLEAETKIKEDRAKAISTRRAAEIEELVEAVKEPEQEEDTQQEAGEEAAAEAPKEPEVKAEAEVPAEEKAEPTEETKEEPVTEEKPESKVEEPAEVKTEVEPEVKPEEKPEEKVEEKAEAKAEEKSDAGEESKPEAEAKEDKPKGKKTSEKDAPAKKE